MAPDLITARDHRRPRLYRTTTIEQEHHRAVNIPGARGQRLRPLMTRGEAAPQQVLGGATLTVGNVPRRSRRPCAAFLTAESIRPGDDHPHPSLAGLPPRCSLLTNGGRSSPRLRGEGRGEELHDILTLAFRRSIHPLVMGLAFRCFSAARYAKFPCCLKKFRCSVE